MSIIFQEQTKSFHLKAKDASYLFGIWGDGTLVHYYCGAALPEGEDLSDMGILTNWNSSNDPTDPAVANHRFSPNVSMLEYPTSGVGDLRPAALTVISPRGDRIVSLKYKSHKILPGAVAPAGLPHLTLAEDEAETLAVVCRDAATGLSVTLYYTVLKDYPVILRHTELENLGDAPLTVTGAASATLSLADDGYDLLHLQGHYIQEHSALREPVPNGSFSISSSRGQSGHWDNPFLALCESSATEDRGRVYAASLLYSGSFAISVHRAFQGTLRVSVGMDSATFTWHLAPGETFVTPQTVLLTVGGGIGEMSRVFHRLYSRHLVRGKWKTEKRPLLINSWEAAFFDFTGDKLVAFAREAKKLGVEMLVMDDGWFSRRSDDTSSLGDWWVNEEKLGGTLGELSRRIHAEGLKFGIWYEPEMISPNSDLYRAHPDWCIQADNVPRSNCRQQYVLDLSRPEVVDYVAGEMIKVLDTAEIDYIKWDFNRPLTEVRSAALPPERQGEAWHRFMLGSYALWEKITSRYPDVLFESCASGGGRFDAGMLYHAPQVWASDNTDPVDRLHIQMGLSLCYPILALGSHVSAHPRTGYAFKGDVALFGSFGYELDPLKLRDEDREVIKNQVAEFHRSYDVIHFGDQYRLLSPWESSDRVAMMTVSEEKDEALVLVATLTKPHNQKFLLRLKGLLPDATYRVEELDKVASGRRLMEVGLNLTGVLPVRASHESILLHLHREN